MKSIVPIGFNERFAIFQNFTGLILGTLSKVTILNFNFMK